MKRSKWLYNTILKECKTNSYDTKLGVVGIFDTEKVLWKYYVVSYYVNSSNDARTSEDICGQTGQDLTTVSVPRYGKEFKTIEEGIEFIETYKIKWETGSNSTLEEKRDKKLSQILDEEKD